MRSPFGIPVQKQRLHAVSEVAISVYSRSVEVDRKVDRKADQVDRANIGGHAAVNARPLLTYL
jgi:hypothetical protein